MTAKLNERERESEREREREKLFETVQHTQHTLVSKLGYDP
jgi:hypothetical protein